MSTSSSKSEPKNSSPKKEATKKLDFLLDTIDNEVANLADVVEVAGPILDDQTPDEEMPTISLDDGVIGTDSFELDMDMFGESDEPPPKDEPVDNQAQAAMSLDDGVIGTDSLELDMDMFGESDGPPPEGEPVDNQAQAALDAMSDAEGEIEAMLAQEASMDAGSPPATETSKEAVDEDISKALDELLATREVDASKILEKRPVPKQKKEPKKSSVVGEQLSEDLFDDLEKDFKSAGDEAGAQEPNGDEKEFSKNLFEELGMDLQTEKEAATAAEPIVAEEGILEDLLGDVQSEDDEAGKNAGEAATKSGSEEELADLLTEKIEALVARLVEERLSAIAERVIKEKINKIFSSMK
ncbi:MAG: hypothetical protein KJP05_08460 [Deltaproteobacteria bacterium]|nr:hypothetical protein [Deltaproteobacteria bacterium]